MFKIMLANIIKINKERAKYKKGKKLLKLKNIQNKYQIQTYQIYKLCSMNRNNL